MPDDNLQINAPRVGAPGPEPAPDPLARSAVVVQAIPAVSPVQPAPSGAVRNYMWVAPAVSGAVILGFFVILSILLNQEVHRSDVTVSDLTTKIAAADAEKVAAAAGAAKQAADKKVQDLTAAKPQGPEMETAKKEADLKSTAAKNADDKAAAAQAAAQAPTNASPGSLQSVLFTLLGALGAAFTQVVNFWLGSSKGSSDKTALLAAANPVPGAR